MNILNKLICSNCNSKKMSIIDSIYTRHTSQVDIDVLLCECPVCNQIALIEILDDGYIEKSFTQIFPSKEKSINRLPSNLLHSFNETMRCFQANLFIACILMCRRCLDIVCGYTKIPKVKLVNQIKQLNRDGIINDYLMNWASNIRLSGNHAAHDDEYMPASEEASKLLYFTGIIIHFIYLSATSNNPWCKNCGNNLLSNETQCKICGVKS